MQRRQALLLATCIASVVLFLLATTPKAFATNPATALRVSPAGAVGASRDAAAIFAGHSSPEVVPQTGRPVAAAALVALAAAAGAAALIVQNKGGGHGEIGYHLALDLKRKGLKVTMINDSAAKKDKPPFNDYADLEAAGVEVKWADLEGGGLTGALDGVEPCEYVFDNQNVCPKDVQKAVSAWKPKAYAYVSSGGMYKPLPEGPLLETGDVKEDNKQLSIERSAAEQGLAWSAYRPQYIYGPKTGKREYLDWFFDRITRGVKFPIPGDGSLRTTLTHAADVAGMLSSLVEKADEAKGQVFNCATDVRISHREVVELVAKTVGKDPEEVLKNVVFYDPAALKGVELPKKGKFPFRETHFGVGVDKAKEVLGWSPKNTLEQDLGWYYEEYKRLGLDKKDVVQDWDEAVISRVMSSA